MQNNARSATSPSPVALRVTCTFLTAALVGSLVQLVGGSFDAPEGWEVVTALWDGGISGAYVTPL